MKSKLFCPDFRQWPNVRNPNCQKSGDQNVLISGLYCSLDFRHLLILGESGESWVWPFLKKIFRTLKNFEIKNSWCENNLLTCQTINGSADYDTNALSSNSCCYTAVPVLSIKSFYLCYLYFQLQSMTNGLFLLSCFSLNCKTYWWRWVFWKVRIVFFQFWISMFQNIFPNMSAFNKAG